jgi:RNA polymerase sigma factor (sigma-70 family)
MQDLAPPELDASVRHTQELVLRTVATHAESLLRTAYRHSLCADDAHDAYQRSMEIFMRRARTLDPEYVARWLHVVVKREAMEVRRGRSESVAAEDIDFDHHEAQTVASPEERAISAERATRAAEALRRLKPQELRAMWLKALGHSYAEIGQATGYSATDRHWQSYVAFDDNLDPVDTCELNGQTTCGVGGGDWYPNDPNPDFDRASYTDVTGLSASTMIAGVYCRPNVNNICLNGSTLTRAESQIFSAYLTIADTTAPTIGTPTGDGWTTTAWSEGTLPLSLSSTDNTGIGATRVYADGSLIATLQGSCHYDRPRPCVDEPSGAVSLPTTGLADGEHVIALGAVDAAGNETRVTRPPSLRVDNRAPAAPVGLAAAAAVSSTNAFSASWALPADAGSPIVEARYQLCQNGACGPVQTAPSSTGVAGLALPAAGTATLRVWLVDQLGHADDATAATLPLTYAPVAPQQLLPPQTEPQVEQRPDLRPQPKPPAVTKVSAALKLSTTRRIGRRVTITGHLSRKASGHVTIRYRARVAGHLRSVSHRASITSGTFRSTFTLSHTLSTAHTATITITYTGDADTKPATAHTTLRLHTH